MEDYNFWDLTWRIAVIAVLCVLPWTWKGFVTHLVTLSHEYGHAVVGLFTNAHVRKIKIRWDSSGETATIRRSTLLPIGSTLTTLAGYPAPIILGSLLISSIDESWHNILMWVLTGLGLFFLLFIRNFFGLVMALLWIAFFGYLAIFQSPYSTELILWGGIFFVVGGVRDLFGLFRMWLLKEAEGSDLSILKEATRIPQIVSFSLMVIASIVGSYFLLTL
ncbi:MAG: M50 family metallopeptidase [Enterococcus sp.]|nr:M50 family metallopeptidase [Enterococcus sp.]